MLTQNDAAQEFCVLLCVFQNGRRRLQAGIDFDKSRASHDRGGSFGVIESPGLAKAGKVPRILRRRRKFADSLAQPGQVRTTAALRL
jgi:hypothetical protein